MRCEIRVLYGLLCSFALSATASLPAMAEGADIAAVSQAIANTLVPRRADRDGIVSLKQGSLRLQCLNTPAETAWHCEAAGLEGQPWLRNVLTTEKQEELIARGFRPDPATGNFALDLPRTTAPGQLARLMIGVLTDIYDAGPEDLSVYAEWLAAAPCRPRVPAGDDNGGAMATPKVSPYAHPTGCSIKSEVQANNLNYDDPAQDQPHAPPGGPIDLDARYGDAMARELDRIEAIKPGQDLFSIFHVGAAYVQCLPQMKYKRLYCEAASDDSQGKPLERVLTPDERRRKLLDLGFEPPGKVMNYWRYYPVAEFDTSAIARALLAALKDGYGYGGAPDLMLHTDKGNDIKL